MMTKNAARAFNHARHLSVVLIGCLIFLGSLARLEPETRASGGQTQQRATNAEDMLSLANFYYSTNDTTDIAAKQYRQVIANYPNTTEAEAAQYYLASYYHRKYYIRKEKLLDRYKDSLSKAAEEYRRYINKYSRAQSPQWLSDAGFNLALDYFEQESFRAGMDQLQRIVQFDAQKDPSVYVHQLIWSEDPKNVIDQTFNAKELAEKARYFANSHAAQGNEAIVRFLIKWCSEQKNQRTAK